MNWYKTAKLSEEALQILSMSGFTPIEEKTLSNYELHLFKATPMAEKLLENFGLPNYQIGMQREDTSFVDLDQQMSKNPTKSEIPLKEGMAWIKQTIEDWKAKYGDIMAASHSQEKTKTYKAILKRLGINFTETNFMGNSVLII